MSFNAKFNILGIENDSLSLDHYLILLYVIFVNYILVKTFAYLLNVFIPHLITFAFFNASCMSFKSKCYISV